MTEPIKDLSRRNLLKEGLRGICLLSVGGAAGHLVSQSQAQQHVWQIDPNKCISCGLCAVNCVLEESAVKCVQVHAMCGYCKLCTGFFDGLTQRLAYRGGKSTLSHRRYYPHFY